MQRPTSIKAAITEPVPLRYKWRLSNGEVDTINATDMERRIQLAYNRYRDYGMSQQSAISWCKDTYPEYQDDDGFYDWLVR